MNDRKIIDTKKQMDNALRSKDLSKYLLDMLPFPAVIVSKERILVYANKEAEKIEVIPGTHCWDTFGKQASISDADKKRFATNNKIPAKGIKCTFCMADKALETQEETKTITKIGETLFELYWIPLDKNTFFHYGIDITEK